MTTRQQTADLDDAIVEAITREHPSTLRHFYYMLVTTGAVEKTEEQYTRVKGRLLELRRNGTVSNDWVVDGSRSLTDPQTFDSAGQVLQVATDSFRRALWREQAADVLVLTEKDAIAGVLEPITDKWGVALGTMRGHASESFKYRVARRVSTGRTTYIYQLGDHDPSGKDLLRDIERRVRGFAPAEDLHFARIAVTEEQIEELNLPTRPTKQSDPRARNFEGESVEVDALPLGKLQELTEKAITRHIDPDIWDLGRAEEEKIRGELQDLTDLAGDVGIPAILSRRGA